MKKFLAVLLIFLLLPGCTLIQKNSIPETFNYALKVSIEKVEIQGTPIFVDEAKKIFIVKSIAHDDTVEIKSGENLDALKTVLEGDGKLFVDTFDEQTMYFTKEDGTYLSENSGSTFRKIFDNTMKIVSIGFNYSGDVFVIGKVRIPNIYSLYKIVDKEKLIKLSTIAEGYLPGASEFVFNPENASQFIVNGFITNDGGKTFTTSDKLSNKSYAYNPYNTTEIYGCLDRFAPVLLMNTNFEDFQYKKVYPLNPISAHQDFEQFYTDFDHKITYGIDNYNTLYTFIDDRVFRINRFDSDTQLKMEFPNGSDVFYLLQSEGNFYYRVKILGEDKENPNISIVKSDVEVPETSFTVPFTEVKSTYVDISPKVIHYVKTVAISNDAFAYAEIESGPGTVTKETLKIFDINTKEPTVVSVSDESELRIGINGEVNDEWLLYSTIIQMGRDDAPVDENSFKVYAYNRKTGKSKLILQFSDIKVVFSSDLKGNLTFEGSEPKFALSGNTAFITINGEISNIVSEGNGFRTNYLNSCAVIFRIDLSSNSTSVVFKDILPAYDTHLITQISSNSEYMMFSYAGLDNIALYLYSLKDNNLQKIGEVRGYDAILTEDNGIIFEDNGVVYVAQIDNLEGRIPIAVEDMLITCVASTNYIAYPYTYKENDTYMQGVEVYNRTNYTKALIKNCYLSYAFLSGDMLTLFECDPDHPNRLYFINLKDNGF